jgi:LAO/AO transport system kinase
MRASGVRRRRRLSLAEYVNGIVAGDRTALARAITLIESSRPQDAELAQQIIDACLPQVGESIRIGITGVPGAGKSTFIETLGTYLVGQGNRVAVLAVDPSSERSGGSILGDKTRMERLANSEMAFIRPSPTGGSLGGVARRTRESMVLCEAAGFRTILIETVGVGQSETLVHGMVDFFLLLMIAGAGDELQGIKRGIVEMADLLTVNKADGANLKAAESARREYARALHLFPARESGWTPTVLTCSARTGKGIAELWEVVLRHRAQTQASGWLVQNRRQQRHAWLREAMRSQLLEQFRHDEQVQAALPAIEAAVQNGELSPARAAQTLIERFRSGA